MTPSITHAQAVHRQQCLEQAARCRRLAYTQADQQSQDQLLTMAADFERNAWGVAPADQGGNSGALQAV